MANKTISEREIVLAVLLEITEKGGYSHLVLRDVLNKYKYLEKKERAFITRVTEGTLEHLIELDYIIDQFSKTKTRKMKPVIRGILRMSVYQIKYMNSVPAHAVCNEAVKLAVKKGFSGLKGFVNGVLRSIVKGLGQISYPGENEPEKRLSVQYSIPEWLIRMWMETYSAETLEKMLQAFQEEAPVTIRCNLQKTTPEELKAALESSGIKVEAHPYLDYAFCISGFDLLERLPGFQEGWFFVQDISSMLAGQVALGAAGKRENDKAKEQFLALDVCAAPGGKALHLAELLGESGRVEARDLTEYKVGILEENIARSGFSNVSAKQWDARIVDEAVKEKADLVLADLPCSGLGVLGRKPDLRYRMTRESACELAALQREILSAVAEYVKPGGMLLYSTCTIHTAENEKNAEWFLETHPEFSWCNITQALPQELQTDVQQGGMLQLLPGIHNSDGFFLAKFIRKSRKETETE